jgi:hypothetical protein
MNTAAETQPLCPVGRLYRGRRRRGAAGARAAAVPSRRGAVTWRRVGHAEPDLGEVDPTGFRLLLWVWCMDSSDLALTCLRESEVTAPLVLGLGHS